MNDQQRAAMQFALHTLEMIWDDGLEGTPMTTHHNAITALREALQEHALQTLSDIHQQIEQPQGEWVDLTDDEILAIAIQYDAEEGISDVEYGNRVLKAFKEKNTPPVVAQGEPVAWVIWGEGNAPELTWDTPKPDDVANALYYTPPSVEAATEATKEKAAKVCEEQMGWLDNGGGELCAAAIRGMK